MAVDYLSAINSKGSGLNITQIVDSLVEAEKAPQENSIQTRIDAKNTAISAIGEIKSALSKLSTSLSTLTGNTSLNVNSSSTAISASISNPSVAVSINSSISVSNIAKGVPHPVNNRNIISEISDNHNLAPYNRENSELFKKKMYSPKLSPSAAFSTESFLKARELFLLLL